MITKSDLCWVLVRAAGVYLLYTAASILFGFLFTDLRIDPINFYPPLGLGLYLLFSGKAIHACLMALPDGSQRAGTDLEGAELEAFQLWLQRHPEFSTRSPEERMALFQDSLRPRR